VSSNECPVSQTTPLSVELTQAFDRSQALQECGVSSTKVSSLPIPLADAFIILTSEQNALDNARAEANHRDVQNNHERVINLDGKQ
jgi:hypothetical protein